MKKHYFLLPLLTIAAACASTSGEPRVRGIAQYEGDPRLGEEVRNICFASSIDGFGETTRDTVIVNEGRDYYLIETFGTCFNLDYAQSIGFDAQTGCLTKGDHLIVSENIMPTGRDRMSAADRCTISAIYAWDPEAQDDSEETTDIVE